VSGSGVERGIAVWTVLAGALSLSGCYTYASVDPLVVEPGLEVRAHLSVEGRNLTEELWGRRMSAVEGKVLDADAARILLEVPAARLQSGFQVSTLNQRVSLSKEQVLEVELRQLDRGRTGVVVAAVALGTVLLVTQAFRGGLFGERCMVLELPEGPNVC
jgi:hypothetical protein